ncbi:MAG: N-acetylmuramoyl-L-alanine amidase [Patescibacteria group bacterium]
MKHLFIAFCAVVLLGVPWLVRTYPQSTTYIDTAFSYIHENLAALLLGNPVTVAELQNKYKRAPRRENPVKILLMPGHEPGYGGAEYGNLRERELNVELASYLEELLDKNEHYEVIVARDNEVWNPVLATYFSENWQSIISFFESHRDAMLYSLSVGAVTKPKDPIHHNSAPRDIALRLYGINKWVNENDVDIAVHIHFNDYPRRNSQVEGKHTGLAIYVPERQYQNSTTTRAVADFIFKRLLHYSAVSDLPKEEEGIIEEQELIAIGSHNTVDAASMLIEYGYIYQPELQTPEMRELALRELAFQTYLGLQDFFGSGNDVSFNFNTLVLPHTWNEDIKKQATPTRDVFALQTALILEGLYPPAGNTKNECPRTGKFGPCTEKALTEFQKKYSITGEHALVGEKTRSILNSRYSPQAY